MSTLTDVRAAVGDWLEESIEREFTPAEERLYHALRLPADGVIVTPDSLARAMHAVGIGCYTRSLRNDRRGHIDLAVAILAALAAEGGPA